MKTITILSGKGGVGKSSITAALADMLSEKHNIVCADCDVDASNLHLFFSNGHEKQGKRLSTNEEAVIDYEKCKRCGLCAQTCYFDAIQMKEGTPRVKNHGCEGCGACTLVCPHNAIRLEAVENATMHTTTDKFTIISAQLDPGATGSGKVVAAVKEEAIKHAGDYLLIDAAAGIGCPVIASVAGSDYCLIIIEPTRASISDAKRAIEIAKHFNSTYGVIINKADLHPSMTDEIRTWAAKEGIAILGEIKYDNAFTKAIRQMRPITRQDKHYKEVFTTLAQTLVDAT